MTLTTKAPEGAPEALDRNEGGITLLEAYSALARQKGGRAIALEIPSPGQPTSADPEDRFWTFTFRNVG